MNGRKTALVCGMAKSGVASARLLWEQGYQVTINDMKKEIPGLKEQLAGIEYRDALGQDPMELVAGQDLVVLSPVIPIFAPFAKKAKALGAEVIGEIELGYRYCDPKARFVCVSGTNGKTTTTALTGALFQGAGKRAFVLGNIGVPITQEAKNTRPGELQIPGAHNLENAMCAATLALCMGLEPAAVCRGLKAFPGVEHRIEFVREVGGVRYVNDSKGTNPDSTIKAVLAMDRPTVLLLGVGNYDKHSDFRPLFEAFGGRVKAVLASGCNIPAIQKAAAETGFTPFYTYDGPDFEGMIRRAGELAAPGDTVLLSPAAASWGQFDNYEQRGEMFKAIVNRL